MPEQLPKHIEKHLDKPSLFTRIHLAFGPLLGALLLDLTDLITYGHVGTYTGFIAGPLVAWWVGLIEGFSLKMRIFWMAFAGTYCVLPFTEFLPVVTVLTLISAVGRFKRNC
ncbi:MAG: hypothetical protein GY862_34580 [Gammaproteobacteria bacterium]|nr:hypothetical protein [Gammaproteobacteria bacterium]